ncbi:hypothetical protein J2T38_000040 [Neisseria perflava]|nr:hypothetical protein [Neisseria perflava]
MSCKHSRSVWLLDSRLRGNDENLAIFYLLLPHAVLKIKYFKYVSLPRIIEEHCIKVSRPFFQTACHQKKNRIHVEKTAAQSPARQA